MDTLVAEKVLGWMLANRLCSCDLPWFYKPGFPCPSPVCGKCEQMLIPFYSTDIIGAWGIVTTMRNRGYHVVIETLSNGRWWVAFRGYPHVNPFTGETVMEAICRAALASAGVEA